MKHIDLDIKIHEYPCFDKFENFVRFYEEIENCAKEMKKLLEIVHILKNKQIACIDYPNSNKDNEINSRNYDTIILNFNFVLSVLNLFKLDDEIPIHKILKKISFCKLFLFIKVEFSSLRKLHPYYYFFQIEEENRYLDSLKVLFSNRSNFFPSKVGFLYLRHIRFYIYKINKYVFNNESRKSQLKLSFYNAKFNYLCVVACHCLTRYENNLFELNFNSDRWKSIKKNSEYELVKCFKHGERHHKFTQWFTNFINALYYAIDMPKFKTSITSVFKLFINVVYLALFSKVSKCHRIINMTKPNLEMSKHIFESYESTLINIPYTLLRTHSNVNFKFFIKLFGVNNQLTNSKNYIGLSMRKYSKKDGFNEMNTFNFRLLTNIPDLKFRERVVVKESFFNQSRKHFFTNKNYSLKRNLDNSNCFLRIFVKHLEKSLKDRTRSNYFKKISDSLVTLSQTDVLFYIHGGGFISQTTESCAGFLSDLCTKIPCLIFSFDYKLFPEHNLEEIISECNQAFEILIPNFEKLFGSKIRKLILSGDSAGGFLTLQLTNYIIRNNLRIPDSLILIYPCSRVHFEEATPSNYLSLTEYIMDTSYLNEFKTICKLREKDSKYFNQKFKESFSFYSTPDEIVRKFPRVSLIVATNDPLRDECFKLADFFLSRNVSLDLKEFLYFPHGFMNLTSMVDSYYNLGLEYFISCVKKGFDNVEISKY